MLTLRDNLQKVRGSNLKKTLVRMEETVNDVFFWDEYSLIVKNNVIQVAPKFSN